MFWGVYYVFSVNVNRYTIIVVLSLKEQSEALFTVYGQSNGYGR